MGSGWSHQHSWQRRHFLSIELKSGVMKTILFLLTSSIFLYALLILVLFFMQRSLLYFPSNEKT